MKTLNAIIMKYYAAMAPGSKMAVLMGDVRRKGIYHSMFNDIVIPGTVLQTYVKMQNNCVSDGRTYSNRFTPIGHEMMYVIEKAMNAYLINYKIPFEKLTDYYFTGGMPEAVQTWFEMADQSILLRTQAVTQIHQDLVSGYLRDFGKYAGKVDATLLEAVFRNVPAQLSMVMDESVKRFKFKGVHEKKSRYSDFESAITWLERCRLILKNRIRHSFW
jgi:hypothetical protein